MHDDSVNLLGAIARGDVADVAQNIGSRLNPLIKYPLELATDHDIYRERPLSTVTPDAGSTLQNIANGNGKPQPFISQEVEHALRNTPLTRYLSTLRRVTDRERNAAALAASLGLGVHYSE